MNQRVLADAGLFNIEAAGLYSVAAKLLGDQPPITATARKDSEARREQRVYGRLPVDLGTATGVTRDVSESGIFFETDATYPLSSSVKFDLAFETPNGTVLFQCHGDIVRIEPRDKKVGVAVKIIKSFVAQAWL